MDSHVRRISITSEEAGEHRSIGTSASVDVQMTEKCGPASFYVRGFCEPADREQASFTKDGSPRAIIEIRELRSKIDRCFDKMTSNARHLSCRRTLNDERALLAKLLGPQREAGWIFPRLDRDRDDMENSFATASRHRRYVRIQRSCCTFRRRHVERLIAYETDLSARISIVLGAYVENLNAAGFANFFPRNASLSLAGSLSLGRVA